MDNFVWAAGKYKPHVTIEAASRLSQGHWGQDRLHAWDITVHPGGDDRFEEFGKDLTAALNGYQPMMCCPFWISLDAEQIGKTMCLIEFGHSDVLQDLMKGKIITWVGFVMPKMAVVALAGPDKNTGITPETLRQFLDYVVQYNHSHQGDKAHHYINQVMVSKAPSVFGPIQEATHLFPDMVDRVVYDRHAKHRSTASEPHPQLQLQVIMCG